MRKGKVVENMSCKLDAAIADVLGYKVITDNLIYPGFSDFWTQKGDLPWYKVPKYSSDGEAMLELSAEMQERGWVVDIGYYFNVWVANYYHTDKPMAKGRANNEPMARALAAYKALTGKEWKHDNDRL